MAIFYRTRFFKPRKRLKSSFERATPFRGRISKAHTNELEKLPWRLDGEVRGGMRRMARNAQRRHITDVTAHVSGGGEEGAVVFFRFEEYNVEFRKEQQNERDDG